MTVTYYPKIATIKFAVTLRLLGRWKGSLYKLVFPDVAMFCAIYTTISLVYRFALTDEQRVEFDKICMYIREYSGTTTVTFCLGFFVSYVLGRWWEYFRTMPWMYTPGYHIRQAVVPPFAYTIQQKMTDHGPAGLSNAASDILKPEGGAKRNETQEAKRKQFEEVMHIRLTMVRYMLLGWIWMMRRISKPVLIRFKPHENFSDSKLIDKLRVMNCDPFIQKYFPKLITDTEIEATIAYAKRIIGDDFEKYEPDHWVPLDWICDLVHDARARGYIPNDFLAQDLLETFRDFRGGLGMLRFMDMFNVPLVYTQVVALCMYIYLLLNCFATQFIDKNKPDLYVPVPFILQLTFLFGWLRVSEVCLNPFGEDDDDFPTWQILNMNLETAYKIVNVFDLDLIDDPVVLHADHKVQVNTRKGPSTTDWTAAQRAATKRRISMQSGRSNPNSSLLPSINGLPSAFEQHDHPEKTDLIGFHFDDHRHSAIGSDHSISAEHESDEFQMEMNDRLRANYERFKRKYDRPSYQGSAIENELSSKNQHQHHHAASADAPRRAQSKLSLGVTRLVTDIMQIPAHLVHSPSRSNLTYSGSRHDLAHSSRTNLAHQKHTAEDDRLLAHAHVVTSDGHETEVQMRTSQLSLASNDAYKHSKRLSHNDETQGAHPDRRSRHTSIIIPPVAAAIRDDAASGAVARPQTSLTGSNSTSNAALTSSPIALAGSHELPVFPSASSQPTGSHGDLHTNQNLTTLLIDTNNSTRSNRSQFGTVSDSKHSLNKITEATEPQSPSSSESALINLNQVQDEIAPECTNDQQQLLTASANANQSTTNKRRRTGMYASGDLGLQDAEDSTDNAPPAAATNEVLKFIDHSDNAEDH